MDCAANSLRSFEEKNLFLSYKNLHHKIKELIKEREKARKEKDFEKADKIREEIKNKGYNIEDTKEGSRIKK